MKEDFAEEKVKLLQEGGIALKGGGGGVRYSFLQNSVADMVFVWAPIVHHLIN